MAPRLTLFRLRGGSPSKGSHLPPPRLVRLEPVRRDRTHAANGDRRRLLAVRLHPVIVRGLRDATNEGSGGRGNGAVGIEGLAARDPPGSRDDDAQTVGFVPMRGAHEARIPFDQNVIDARLRGLAVQTCRRDYLSPRGIYLRAFSGIEHIYPGELILRLDDRQGGTRRPPRLFREKRQR